MSTDANQELIQFHQFLSETLATSKPLPSPEEALDQWRSTHPASEEDGSEEDGSEEDGSEEDGSEEDGSEEDGSEEDGSEEDGSEADGSETDGEDVDEFNDYDETVAAIQEALDDPRPNVPWEVFKQELRDQHERLKRT